MVEEAYVSFETAKLLKEKGFDVKCRYYYIQTGEMFELDIRFHTVLTTQELLNLQIVGEKEERCVAPTLSVAMKWLREVHNLHVDSSIYTDTDGDSEHEYTYTYWDWLIFNSESGRRIAEPQIGCGRYDSYEQACEAAIKYCLENLI